MLRISNTTKVGDREVVRTRSLIRVSANLTMTSTEFAANVPPFNAQKLLAVAGGCSAVEVQRREPGAIELLADQREVRRELAEHERAMPLGLELLEQLEQAAHLR